MDGKQRQGQQAQETRNSRQQTARARNNSADLDVNSLPPKERFDPRSVAQPVGVPKRPPLTIPGQNSPQTSASPHQQGLLPPHQRPPLTIPGQNSPQTGTSPNPRGWPSPAQHGSNPNPFPSPYARPPHPPFHPSALPPSPSPPQHGTPPQHSTPPRLHDFMPLPHGTPSPHELPPAQRDWPPPGLPPQPTPPAQQKTPGPTPQPTPPAQQKTPGPTPQPTPPAQQKTPGPTPQPTPPAQQKKPGPIPQPTPPAQQKTPGPPTQPTPPAQQDREEGEIVSPLGGSPVRGVGGEERTGEQRDSQTSVREEEKLVRVSSGIVVGEGSSGQGTGGSSKRKGEERTDDPNPLGAHGENSISPSKRARGESTGITAEQTDQVAAATEPTQETLGEAAQETLEESQRDVLLKLNLEFLAKNTRERELADENVRLRKETKDLRESLARERGEREEVEARLRSCLAEKDKWERENEMMEEEVKMQRLGARLEKERLEGEIAQKEREIEEVCERVKEIMEKYRCQQARSEGLVKLLAELTGVGKFIDDTIERGLKM